MSERNFPSRENLRNSGLLNIEYGSDMNAGVNCIKGQVEELICTLNIP